MRRDMILPYWMLLVPCWFRLELVHRIPLEKYW